MNLKISVIMPIYNAGKYLENAINSVINQTIGFENIELILVDDCSTDNSKSIMEEYSNTYSNIKSIFLEENSGWPSIPRNVGIKNATSDYIMFIDNDDEYFPEICDKLYNTIISENADIVVCDKIKTDNNNASYQSFNSDNILFGNEIVYLDNVFIWNCIFKKSIILNNNISFIDAINEDTLFTLEYYIHSNKLVYLNGFIGYNHISRIGSGSTLSFEFVMGIIKSFDLILKLFEHNSYDLNRFFKPKIEGTILFIMMLGNKDEMGELLSALSDFEKRIDFTGNLPILCKFINFFILHGNLTMATYMCLFFSRIRESNLLLNVYRKFFLDNPPKEVE